MPNRLLREGILDSDLVNLLGWPEEIFYRRLMSVVDDFGRFDARPAVLRSRLYPLKLETVREADITRWIAECVKAGLIALYHDNGRQYLLFRKFNQHVRAKTSKYPAPPPGVDDALHTHSTCSADASHVRSETEAHSETNAKAQTETGTASERFEKFIAEYPKKTGRKEALAVFLRLDPGDELLGTIIAALARKRRCADWQREEGRYVPRAEKWLEDRGWEEFTPRRPGKPKTHHPPESVADESNANAEEWRRIRSAQAAVTMPT